MGMGVEPANRRAAGREVIAWVRGHSPWRRTFCHFLVVLLLGALSACGDGVTDQHDPTASTMPEPMVRQPAQDLGVIQPDPGGNPDPNMDRDPVDAAVSPFPDAAVADPMDVMDPPPEPMGIRYLRIQTTESPSWVAWHEVQILVDGQNIALGIPATASGSTGDGPASNAIDGDLTTAWNSGDFPPASMTFDLGRPHGIEEVRLLVAQSPPGQTAHHLAFAGEDRNFFAVHTWRQATESGQWLAWRGDPTPDPGRMDDPPDLPDGLGRGLRWVRTNPMFISGLTVRMPAPSIEDVRGYFDDFGATAVHLWGTGLPNRMNGWRDAAPRPPRFVSWVENDGRSLDGHEIIGGYGANEPGRIGYQVGDEPLSMEEFLPIEEGLRVIRQIDPEALLIVNFSFWAEGLDAILDHYGTLDADVVSFDTYSMGREVYGRMGIFRAAALEMGRPYWCYLVGYGDDDRAQFPDATGMRWAAMAHATYGYTGYTWFLYQIDPAHGLMTAMFEQSGVFDSARTPLFEVAAQINRELKVLGRALTQLTSTAVRYVPALGILAQPPNTENWSRGAGGDPFLVAVETDGLAQDVVLGFFTDDAGGRYFMVQNPNHTRGTFPTGSTDDAVVRLRFDFSSRVEGPLDHLEWLNVRSGAVDREALSHEGGDAAVLSLTLPAGDARLFKYPSAQPFALGAP